MNVLAVECGVDDEVKAIDVIRGYGRTSVVIAEEVAKMGEKLLSFVEFENEWEF